MLRIAKSTPGVLDLSAVKDEHGIPVTLIGSSHRDVPDHEEDNPVLQRIVELGWVVLSKVPIVAPDEPALNPAPDLASTSDLSTQGPVSVTDALPRDPAVPAEPEPVVTTDLPSANVNPDTQNNDHTTTSVADVAPSAVVKPERKPSRRT